MAPKNDPPHHPKNSPSLKSEPDSAPAVTPTALLSRFLGRETPHRSTENRPQLKGPLFLRAGPNWWRIDGLLSACTTRWVEKRPPFAWQILSPLQCPARFLRGKSSPQKARKLFSFLLEPQIPLPLEECQTAGILQTRSHREWEALTCYARREDCLLEEGQQALFGGSLAAVGASLWLSQQGGDLDGVWALPFPDSVLVFLLAGHRAVGVRAIPSGDSLRLEMAALELGGSSSRRWLGPSPPAGWQAQEGPDWAPPDSSWLAFCALAIAWGGLDTNLVPLEGVGKLQLPWIRKLCWSVSGAFCLLAGGCLIATHAILQQQLAQEAVDEESILGEMEHLAGEIRDASAPFRPEPPLPRCSQVLRWLAQLPGLQHDGALSVERLRYQITSYPTAGKERESYAGKVSLEFACKDAFRARQILDRISQQDPTSCVDTRAALEWSHHQGLYRMSFLLKSPQSS